ncbi:tumor necrosis factor receptor superfamily member 9-like [Betta splendens]|uniref:Tumor necrosis factor receptor superfamily member 9-like n=1 Tax=Betta splendens TaxID=158456 RepID=A0A6P7N1A1_BETSP|nr:tumor necrosis factor receptor superfamily member 9-like [Betta splendens]
MAVVLRAALLWLLMHSCLCSVGQTDKGCMKWNLLKNTDDVCCEECYPGNHVVNKCGPNASSLCAPCEAGTYIENPKSDWCQRCKTCVGALVQVKACTTTSNTVCTCKEGLLCGDAQCSFCVTKCGKGQEPEKRSCRPCPDGTFNDQIHQYCKPWSTSCPKPDQQIVANGNASTDIKCENVPVSPLQKPNQPDTVGQVWPLMLSAVTSMALIGFIIIVAVKILRKKKRKPKKTDKKTPIVRIPTDDPMTLIAIECSFHEAQQEQGSSTESLDSKDSSDSSGQLIA